MLLNCIKPKLPLTLKGGYYFDKKNIQNYLKKNLFNLEAALALRFDYQGPKKLCRDKTLEQYCYKAVELHISKFTPTFFYFLEVNMPPLLDKSLEEHWHWTLFGEVLPISITL